ncbi:hypothetical protein GGR54DRAFT_577998 [Hypoxylon sp. NC1633]|nr:hypothetical protein GGR54DRAFT_577998 [Hypoxylon sp. NC1633]
MQALKLVILSISYEDLDPTEVVNKPGLSDTSLWYSEIPDPCLLFPRVESFRTSESKQDLPINLYIFGGDHREYLNNVLWISVWTGHNGILGLEVVSQIGHNPDRLGHHLVLNDNKTEMELYGPGGEHVISLDVFYTKTTDWLTGFEFRTDRDRTQMFPPSLSSDPSLGDWNRRTLSSGPGLVLVGFCAMTTQRGFNEIGIFCAESVV